MINSDDRVRVRFAPSPTGFLHVGGARTALFNWLYARRHGGTFVLRIEDTDAERSSWDMVTGIVDGLRWLGLDWDEGPDIGGPHAPYFQSQRLDQYQGRGHRARAAGTCVLLLLHARDAAAEAAGGGSVWWRMDLRSHLLRARAGRNRRRSPRRTSCSDPVQGAGRHDLVRRPRPRDDRVRESLIEDFVVLRSDGQPTYHLSVVVDDIDMAITHVVRGDDHISNTPKQVLLYQAFGRSVPSFAHVPLILGADKKRLSKRHGATSVTEYQRLGYLPEAMVNFLSLLGWSPGTDEELFTRDELIARFALEGISGGNAVFNSEKLDWFNQQHLLRLPAEEVAPRLEPVLTEQGLWRDAFTGSERDWFTALVNLYKPRIKTLDQFAAEARPVLTDEVVFDPAAVEKHLRKPELVEP